MAPRHSASRLALLLAAALSPSLAFADAPFVPNDPYFYPANTPTLTVGGQWYLDKTNTGAAVDINVTPAWNRGLTGQGITIGIVDERIQYTHPDLAPNYDAANSWNFVDNNATPLPDPTQVTDSHGTAVAGLISARGGNGLGITGVAPLSQFASLAAMPSTNSFLFSDNTTIQHLANAEAYHSTGTNPSLQIVNTSIGESGGYGMISWPSLNAIEQSIRDSTAAGTIHISGVGNNRQKFGVLAGYDADTNRKLMVHMPEVISVAAVNYLGVKTDYSGFGASVFVTAPAGEATLANSITGVQMITTDLSGSAGYNSAGGNNFDNQEYTSSFTGTSATGPLVAGVLAAADEVHFQKFGSYLDTRTAKHILAMTSKLVDPGDTSNTGGWHTNAGGYHFNNNYGFGLIDADAVTQAAANYSGVTPLVTQSTGMISAGNARIPLGDSSGISQTFTLASTGPLEEITLRLLVNDDGQEYITGSHYGELQGKLISPSGTESVLMLANPLSGFVVDGASHDPRGLDWTFADNAFWGEEVAGNWQFIISHPYGSQDGADVDYFLTGFEVTARSGDLISAVPEPSSLALLALAVPALLSRRRPHPRIRH